MKKLSLTINIVLAIAVAVLYYLHFSCANQCAEVSSNTEHVVAPIKTDDVDTQKTDEIVSNIGYINIDSLQSKYALYEELTQKLKNKQTKYERELTSKMTAFEKKVQEFQKQAPTMSQFEGQMKQEELAEEEQKLYKMREDFASKFQQEEMKLNDEFQKTVQAYIQKHNEQTNFDIIIGASQMGNIVLDFKPGIDITNHVVDGLNNEYQNQQNTKK